MGLVHGDPSAEGLPADRAGMFQALERPARQATERSDGL